MISAYIALLIFVPVKFFLLDIVRVGGRDMRASMEAGDAMLVQRNFYELDRGDVVYFRYPQVDSISGKVMLMQRIAALPGDTLQLIDGMVRINGKDFSDPPLVQYNYFVKTKCQLDSLSMCQLNLSEGNLVSDQHDYSFALSNAQVDLLRSLPDIESVERRSEKPQTYDETCFPFRSTFAWNNYYFGKLYIPKIGDTLQLDTAHLPLYQLLLTEYEKNHVVVKSDSIFINEELCKHYVVKKDYFFVLGDNRANANDSRNWGLLPDNLIKGKVVCSLRSRP